MMFVLNHHITNNIYINYSEEINKKLYDINLVEIHLCHYLNLYRAYINSISNFLVHTRNKLLIKIKDKNKN